MDQKIKVHKAINSRIFKIDSDRRLISGVVSEPNTIDLQGDILLEKDIENAAYNYLAGEKIIGYRHQSKAENVTLIEGIVFKNGQFLTNENNNTEEYISKGSFFITLQVNNETIWNEILKEELNSFSIGGWGERIPIMESQLDLSDIQANDISLIDLSKVYHLTNLELEEISIVTWGANNKKFVMRKGENHDGKLWFSKEIKLENGDDNMGETEEELKKAAEEKARLDKEAAEKAEKEKAKKEKAEKELQEILAAKNKAEKEALNLAKELAETKRLAEEAKKAADIEKELRLTKEFVDLAKEQYGVIGEPDKIGKLLKNAHEKLSSEDYAILIETFKGANEKIKASGLLQEFGKNDKGGMDEKPELKLDRMAKEYAEKNKVSYTDALTAVIAANPDLYGKK